MILNFIANLNMDFIPRVQNLKCETVINFVEKQNEI